MSQVNLNTTSRHINHCKATLLAAANAINFSTIAAIDGLSLGSCAHPNSINLLIGSGMASSILGRLLSIATR
jgi:hypothetical protein